MYSGEYDVLWFYSECAWIHTRQDEKFEVKMKKWNKIYKDK